MKPVWLTKLPNCVFPWVASFKPIFPTLGVGRNVINAMHIGPNAIVTLVVVGNYGCHWILLHS